MLATQGCCLNSTMVRLQQGFISKITITTPDGLNSTMVRLQLFLDMRLGFEIFGGLNSTMVRLQQTCGGRGYWWSYSVSLNSTMVRLQLLSNSKASNLSIKVSIPLWFDYNALVSTVNKHFFEPGLNSTMVRLQLLSRSLKNLMRLVQVSIPLWFDYNQK